jgi:hypothetical protein
MGTPARQCKDLAVDFPRVRPGVLFQRDAIVFLISLLEVL